MVRMSFRRRQNHIDNLMSLLPQAYSEALPLRRAIKMNAICGLLADMRLNTINVRRCMCSFAVRLSVSLHELRLILVSLFSVLTIDGFYTSLFFLPWRNSP
jgi:hypothetical protein